MYPNIPLILSIVFLVVGGLAIAKSADLFTDQAAILARAMGISTFVVGMVVVGFGTSAPELVVSALSGISGHSDLSLGNAYGSCIFNVAVILGVAALIRPIPVRPKIAWVAAPALVFISAYSGLLVTVGAGFTRWRGGLMLLAFAILLPLYCLFDQSNGAAPHEDDRSARPAVSLVRTAGLLVVGLVALVASSHVFVWGAVDLARACGVSELVIGLTIVAMGTSLPELAAAVAASRKGEGDLVLGNIVGSNFFNTLAVVGVAGTLSPFRHVSPYVASRDLPFMLVVSFSLFLFGLRKRAFADVLGGRVRAREAFSAPGLVSRVEGCVWLLLYVAYAVMMFYQER